MRAPRQPIMLLLALMVCCVVRVAPAAAQPDPSARAAQFEHNAVIARQQAAALRKSITSWEDGFIKNNRVRAATAPDAKTRAAYANVVKTQEAAVDKMRSQAAFLAKSAEYDDAQAAHIRRHEPIDPRAPINPATNPSIASPSVASSGAVGPGTNRPGSFPGAFPPRPSLILTPVPPSQEVLAYLAIATQDAALARKYAAEVQARMAAAGLEIDQRNAVAQKTLNAPIAQLRATYKNNPLALRSDLIKGFSISPAERAYIVQNFPSVAMTNLDDALARATAGAKPTMYYSVQAANQAEMTQINHVEEAVFDTIKVGFDQNRHLLIQEEEWDMHFADGQAGLHATQAMLVWAQLIQPFRESPAAANPLCVRANKQDGDYIAQMAMRLQGFFDQYVVVYKGLLATPTRLVGAIYKDKRGEKAQIGDKAALWLAQITNDKSLGLPHGNGLGVDIWAQAFVSPLSPDCNTWRAQMPTDLEARYPAVGVGFTSGDAYLTIQPPFGPPPVAAQDASLHVAQGGVWPQDGP